ncbi:MAG: flagellin FliC [Desulfuromonas sp.]|nr:flagellin FliC [Desulfuromonas sp.]
MTINGTNVIDSSTVVDGLNGKSSGSAFAMAKAINGSGTSVRAEAQATTLNVATAVAGNDGSETLDINGVTVLDGTAGGALTIDELADQINVHSSATGVTATVNGTGLDMTASDGRDIDITTAGDGTGANNFTVATNRGSVKLTSAENIVMNGTAQTALNMTGTTIAKDTSTLTAIDVTTVSGASEAIDRLDTALSSIDTIRGGLGAIQNRFESTIANLNNVSENLSAARSRILDADIAQETSAMTKNNILQQAGVSILAQANQAPQLALSLLG